MIYIKRVLTEFNKNEPELSQETINKICSWNFNEIGKNLINEDLETIELFYSSFISYMDKNRNNDINIIFTKMRKQVRDAFQQRL